MIEFKPAVREGVKPLIVLSGESNSGKTFTALLMARGIAGPQGKVMIADTESGRAALYAEEVPGGFLRADIQPPFSPANYIAILDSAEKAGADVLVYDSGSHEWEGEGGVCEMAAENERTGKPGLHNWNAPKKEHKKFMLRLTRSKIPIIFCLRAMHKTRQVKVEKGGRVVTEIVKDEHLTPIQSEGFSFEATVILEMQRGSPGHYILSKWSVPALRDCFPGSGPERISTTQAGIQNGELIAKWISGLPATPPAKDPKPLKAKLWKAVKAIFIEVDVFQWWLQEQMLIPGGKSLGDLSFDELETLIPLVDESLATLSEEEKTKLLPELKARMEEASK